ncbi:hypothetical protein D5S17_26195 [Pseudonocardiaceae bacterium YIM PH 21723]|nr:hypothetical protein D5S17_26195 [Pseudonocardiaceae bacterium YIM PH 21723]
MVIMGQAPADIRTVLLSCHDALATLGMLRVESGEISTMARKDCPDGMGSAGWFSTRTGTTISFYSLDGHLWLQQDRGRTRIPLGTNATLHRDGYRRTLELSYADETIAVLEHEADPRSEHTADIPLADAEDFDFALFIANVLTDRQRSRWLRNVYRAS